MTDLHFHGGFGIDLMTADTQSLDRLASRLFKKGIDSFAPTTLSHEWAGLLECLGRLGTWIRQTQSLPTPQAATPIGIHLEGPFLSQKKRGAHPSSSIVSFSPEKMLQLYEASHQTIKIVTLAPEILTPSDLVWLKKWSAKEKIILSVGHTCASYSQTAHALNSGFHSATHLFNAMEHHNRFAGAPQAVLDDQTCYAEIIPDLIHVAPELVAHAEWLKPKHLFFVSDSSPATETSDTCCFGELKTKVHDGASHLIDQSGALTELLCGGGKLLPEMTEQYLNWKIARPSIPTRTSKTPTTIDLTREAISRSVTIPAKLIGAKPSAHDRLTWKIARFQVTLQVNSQKKLKPKASKKDHP